MKTDMSSFDIMAMVTELQREMRIKKIFQPSPTQLRLQVRFPEGQKGNISVEVGRGMYLSDFEIPAPKFPSNFAMTLRKYLKNAVIDEIKQVGFDRIVEITTETRQGVFKLVLELFGEGNAALIDDAGLIKAIMKPRRFKHRDLLGKKTYSYPPQRLNPFEIGAEELAKIVSEYGSLVKALASPLGLGGLYSEEICLRAGIEKTLKHLTPDESKKIISTLGELKEEALNPSPSIVYKEGEPYDVAPIELLSYQEMNSKGFPSFNKALDEFFTSKIIEDVEEKVESNYKEGLVSINLRLKEQARAIAKFNREIEYSKRVGDTIYSNFDKVQELIESVSKVRKTLPAREISEKLARINWVKQYLPKENVVTVEINTLDFRIDLSLSASKNADSYYKKSKKAKEKLKGARGATEKTKNKIRDYVIKGRNQAEVESGLPVKKEVRKRRWFERFRWFQSSEGLLVIGGRDATSNETIVKRHMEKGDVFVHADISGAPAVLIKGAGDEKTREKTLKEACQFAASNSAAWKSKAAFLDAYWVLPDQVSKTPKSGEYVGKGAFIIRGKRNYIRSVMELAIGFREEKEPMIMCGPPDAIRENCTAFVKITPGPLKSKAAAEQIKSTLIEKTKGKAEAIKKINLDYIQRLLPPGGASIVEK
jgi:predicted ribosome quality control (RQC) complex YloA/Tae2 family protein